MFVVDLFHGHPFFAIETQTAGSRSTARRMSHTRFMLSLRNFTFPTALPRQPSFSGRAPVFFGACPVFFRARPAFCTARIFSTMALLFLGQAPFLAGRAPFLLGRAPNLPRPNRGRPECGTLFFFAVKRERSTCRRPSAFVQIRSTR